MPRAADVQQMFDRIAGRYDLLNRIMTMGIDQRWRRAAVRAAGIGRESHALDVCCGTGDITFLLARAGASRVVGVDFSPNMLAQARLRIGGEEPAVAQVIEFQEGDALSLPFDDDSFDAVTVGFGVRNVEDVPRAFREFARVVRPGGKVVCLEITRPRRQPAQGFYHLWFDRVVPLVGGIVSGDRSAYSYLPESTRHFPPPAELEQVMREAGLDQVGHKLFAGGIVALHTGTVAARQERVRDEVAEAGRRVGAAAEGAS